MARIEDALQVALKGMVAPVALPGIVRSLPESRSAEVGTLDLVRAHELLAVCVSGARLFNPNAPADIAARVWRTITGGHAVPPSRMVIDIRTDHDVLAAQTASQRLMRRLFKSTDVVRVATAVSELARNIYMYAGSGRVTLEVRTEEPHTAVFSVLAEDRGRGIPHLDAVLNGTYRSTTGLGRGLRGAQSLLDALTIQTGPTGTTVRGHRRTRPLLSQ
jgi:anti-sigma regulatory factor (Ser/Thr protein kinase)